jgi:hypothetical protein
MLEGRGRYRQVLFKCKSQLDVHQVPKRGVLQGAVNKPKITSSIGIVDPSIWSLEVETGSRVSQQRFHAQTCYPFERLPHSG